MTKQHWEVLEAIGHFSRKEKNQTGGLSFPKPYQMDFEFMMKLEKLRRLKKNPIIIHNTFAPVGHTKYSQHGIIPIAVADGHIANTSLYSEVKVLVKLFDRVGIYPWSWKSKGWHIDDAVRLNRKEHKVYWIEDEKKTGKYKYFSNIPEYLEAVRKIPSAMKAY